MRAEVGDELVTHGRVVGRHDRTADVVAVLGPGGQPPYRVRDGDGHETVVSPGPDTEVRHTPRGRRR
ncbi:DUF1918 domain-containing protein [Streptomyces sp. TRM 70351]|uniref:DUF1918 domain-containing protein n=1 Tax=Streptomyces sp. TRM 70351 TaxID=3116552 RepID=UPI002E7B4F20|nr:DUF1918 domain-containing protein [Streptomyces sp. TRM 70351]MEE1929131.1 DUF1918 domain-containing protein [Streptomyces sp. TRM 70351]